jgi:hypothetical protein
MSLTDAEVQAVQRLKNWAGEGPGEGYSDREFIAACLHGAEAIKEVAGLREALEDLVQNANRLCDRQLGGTYEEDCRRSIAQARAALSGERKGE